MVANTASPSTTASPDRGPAAGSSGADLPRADGRGADRFAVSVDQYRAFRRDGFLIVRGLLSPADVAELRLHTEQLMRGELPEQQDVEPDDAAGGGSRGGLGITRHLTKPPAHLSDAEKAQFFLRIHMLHRELALHERTLLHPRVLDVLEVLVGPDVLALQSMLFLKPPGKVGQGWHQDSYYIPTHPDTLCGAWIAVDDADERNGAMWFAKGSGAEPVHPPCPEAGYGFGERMVSDLAHVRGASNPVDEENSLSAVAANYDQVLGSVRAGDVVFFDGHVLHRSKDNWTSDRFRRAFVGHYCDARSYTQWGRPEGASDDGSGAEGTNRFHILARGDTHLPFARPKFGTPCAATLPAAERRRASEYAARTIAENGNGLMGCAIADPTVDHKH